MEETRTQSMEENNDVDWISDLPNDVVACILSFMRVKDAVRTCILAKRWRNAWAFIPVLDFDYHKICLEFTLTKNNMCKFERFVQGALLNMEISQVDIFRLCIDGINISDQNLQVICNLILHAMKFKPRVCDVTLSSFKNLNMETDLTFNCASLHHLKLSLYGQQGKTTISSKSIDLPYLKSLDLQNVTITEDFIKKLFSSCIVLDKLVLTDCDLQFTKISSNTLKELNLNCCSPNIGEGVQIFTPNLTHFGGHMMRVSLQNMPSLACANINFPIYSINNYEYITSSPRLFNSLINATTLCVGLISPALERAWSKNISYCKTFNNLESLTLGGCYFGNDFKLVRFFLQYSPKLRALNLSYDDLDITRFLPLKDCIGDILEETSLEKGDVSIRRVYLGTVEIVMWEKREIVVDFLMQKLLLHVNSNQ